MALGKRILPEALRSIDSATFTGSYQALGTATDHPIVLAKFTNNSDVLVTVSWNGVADHDILPAGSYTVYDMSANSTNPLSGLSIGQETQFYVKGTAGTGLVYLTTFYVVGG